MVVHIVIMKMKMNDVGASFACCRMLRVFLLPMAGSCYTIHAIEFDIMHKRICVDVASCILYFLYVMTCCSKMSSFVGFFFSIRLFYLCTGMLYARPGDCWLSIIDELIEQA